MRKGERQKEREREDFACLSWERDTIVIFSFIYRHGFNKQTYATFFKDKLLAILLSAVIGAPVVSAILWIIKAGGDHFYFYLWFFFLCFQLIMLTIYPTVIAPLFNKYEPLPEGPLKKSIEALASRVIQFSARN